MCLTSQKWVVNSSTSINYMNGLFNECGCTIKITNERDSKDCMDVYFE